MQQRVGLYCLLEVLERDGQLSILPGCLDIHTGYQATWLVEQSVRLVVWWLAAQMSQVKRSRHQTDRR
jgi:hypothetical protein